MKLLTHDPFKFSRNGILLNAIPAALFAWLIFQGDLFIALSGLAAMSIATTGLLLYNRVARLQVLSQLSLLSGLKESKSFSEHIERIHRKESATLEFLGVLLNKDHEGCGKIQLDNSALGEALRQVRDLFSGYQHREQQLKWTQGGIARFAEIVKDGDSIEEFSVNVISQLVRYIDANQGGIFIESRDEQGQRILELKGCYAYDKRKHLDKAVAPGEGILGECMLDHSFTYLKNIPQDYVNITSGLGNATPRNLVVAPLMFRDQFVGAIELASFKLFDQHELDFLRKVTESIAAEVASRTQLARMENLLNDSQHLADTLRSREEDMRLHVEELTSTQEEMKRNQAELDSLLTAINKTVASIELDLKGGIRSANDIFLSITGYQQDEIRSMTYFNLLPASERDGVQTGLIWDSLRDGKHFEGEFRLIDKHRRELFLHGTFNPILDSRGRPHKVIMIAQFNSDEKIKLQELTNAVAAAKNSVPYVELNSQFEYKSANERFLKLFGMRRMELKSKCFTALLDRKIVDECRQKISDAGNHNYFEADLAYVVNGNSYIFRTSFTLVRNNDNVITKIIVILSDQLVTNKIAAVA